MRTSLALFALLALLSTACEKKESIATQWRKNRVEKPKDTNIDLEVDTGKETQEEETAKLAPVVMVVDTEIDPNSPAYEDQVIGQYTYGCKSTVPEPAPDASLEEMKEYLIAAFKPGAEACTLNEGISYTLPDDYKEIEALKETWNKAVSEKDLTPIASDFQKIQGVLRGESTGISGHGTSTAGLIAYKNPDVKLVLVKFEGIASGTETPDPENLCSQALFDLQVKAYEDPRVVQAYLEQTDDPAMLEVAKKFQVQIVNLSFGAGTRKAMEKQLTELCGRNIDLSGYFKRIVELENQRVVWQKENREPDAYATKILSVQASGNDGGQVDSLLDGSECHDLANGLILVGAFNANRQRSGFSNFGKCVDFYSLGESVTVPALDGFKNVVNGTSFSAPLVVRYLSMHTHSTSSVTDMIQVLQGNADSAGFLAASTYPDELAFPDFLLGGITPAIPEAPVPNTPPETPVLSLTAAPAEPAKLVKLPSLKNPLWRPFH